MPAKTAIAPPTAQEVLTQLEALGTEQARKTYRRHGASGPVYGVSYADLGKLTRKLRGQDELAVALWRSDFLEAKVLATMIADPGKTDHARIKAWAAQVKDRGVACALGDLIAKAPDGLAFSMEFIHDSGEWTSYAAFNALAGLAIAQTLPEREATSVLDLIEREITARPNYTRYAMNSALIAIGAHLPPLTERALEVAANIGKVEVDHGDTACKTPDAAGYIRKTIDHYTRRVPK